jgi:hypothetical protein
MLKNTLVLLQGNHATLVKNQTPQQFENELRAFLRRRSEDPTTACDMFYVQPERDGDNGLCIEPGAIVALVPA